MATVSIPPRFCGPPTSAHGGYTAGLLGAALGGGPASVRLHRPPPLDRPLELAETSDGVALGDDDGVIAEGVPDAPLGVEPFPSVDPEVAEECEHRFMWHEGHPFDTCFGCGTRRRPGDAWCTFGGELPGGGVVASRAHAPTDLLAPDGGLPLVQRWAALDCITAAAGSLVDLPRDPPWLLGSLSVDSHGEVDGRVPLVVVGRPVDLDGRKFVAEAALEAGGEVVGWSRATWIQLRG